MSADANLDPDFIRRQRAALEKLRAALQAAALAAKAEPEEEGTQAADEPHEKGEDASRLQTLEVDVGLLANDTQRLARVERALAKIDEGTYGLSDESGLPIPRPRLEVMPEALYTVAEQERREAAA